MIDHNETFIVDHTNSTVGDVIGIGYWDSSSGTFYIKNTYTNDEISLRVG